MGFLCGVNERTDLKYMKTTLFLLVLLAAGMTASAQNLAMADNKSQIESVETDKVVSDKATQFVFQNYGVDLNHSDLRDYPEHALGDEVARKMFATQKIYVHRQASTLGFSDYTLEICKPAIYNAVTRLDGYFKKAVRRNEINASDASAELAKCLDLAYLAYYEQETENLEQALRKAKSPAELLSVFRSISVEE